MQIQVFLNLCPVINPRDVYFFLLQRDADGGVEYCRRKVMLVKEKVEQLAKIIQTRQVALEQIKGLIIEKSNAVAS